MFKCAFQLACMRSNRKALKATIYNEHLQQISLPENGRNNIKQSGNYKVKWSVQPGTVEPQRLSWSTFLYTSQQHVIHKSERRSTGILVLPKSRFLWCMSSCIPFLNGTRDHVQLKITRQENQLVPHICIIVIINTPSTWYSLPERRTRNKTYRELVYVRLFSILHPELLK